MIGNWYCLGNWPTLLNWKEIIKDHKMESWIQPTTRLDSLILLLKSSLPPSFFFPWFSPFLLLWHRIKVSRLTPCFLSLNPHIFFFLTGSKIQLRLKLVDLGSSLLFHQSSFLKMTIPNSDFMMENGVCDFPSTPEEEKLIVSELTNESENNLKEGNLYFVISKRFLLLLDFSLL